MYNIFTSHPHKVQQTYVKHLIFALKNGFSLILYGILLILHAIFPFIFENTSRDAVIKMGNVFSDRMRKRSMKVEQN
jgi:hypothetical protein